MRHKVQRPRARFVGSRVKYNFLKQEKEKKEEIIIPLETTCLLEISTKNP